MNFFVLMIEEQSLAHSAITWKDFELICSECFCVTFESNGIARTKLSKFDFILCLEQVLFSFESISSFTNDI